MSKARCLASLVTAIVVLIMLSLTEVDAQSTACQCSKQALVSSFLCKYGTRLIGFRLFTTQIVKSYINRPTIGPYCVC